MTDPFTPLRDSSTELFLLFERGKGFFGWVVRLFTRSKYAHVSVGYKHPLSRSLRIIDATPDAVKTRDLPADFRKGKFLVVPLSGVLVDLRVLSVILYAENEPYDYIDAIRAGIGLEPRNSGYQCAELAVDILRAAKQPGWASLLPTPQNLLDFARSLPEHTEFEVTNEW